MSGFTYVNRKLSSANKNSSQRLFRGQITMQDVPLDVFVFEIFPYFTYAELLPLSFTNQHLSVATEKFFANQNLPPAHLQYPCYHANVTRWWKDEIRKPCIEEIEKIIEIGDEKLLREVFDGFCEDHKENEGDDENWPEYVSPFSIRSSL